MNIIEFFFGIFKECFDVINVDFFGLGFTWLEFLLGVAIIFVVLGFLKSVIGVGDSISFDNLVYNYKMSNKNRENEISSMYITKNLDSGVITIRQQKYYKDKNFTESYITSSKGGK